MSEPTREPTTSELLAQLDEAELLISLLRSRAVTLNHEVRMRDVRIAALEAPPDEGTDA